MAESERGSLEWGTFAYSFANRLVIIRKDRGYSQEELAERSGMHRNAVSNLERATSNRHPFISDPQLSTVYRLARALDVPPSWLLPDLNVKLPTRSREQNSVKALSAVETELQQLLGGDAKE